MLLEEAKKMLETIDGVLTSSAVEHMTCKERFHGRSQRDWSVDS